MRPKYPKRLLALVATLVLVVLGVTGGAAAAGQSSPRPVAHHGNVPMALNSGTRAATGVQRFPVPKKIAISYHRMTKMPIRTPRVFGQVGSKTSAAISAVTSPGRTRKV